MVCHDLLRYLVLTPCSDIKGQLQLSSGEPGLHRLIDHAQDVFEPLKGIQEAIFQYQVCPFTNTLLGVDKGSRWADKK